MVKASLLCQFLLVACCVSLVVVSAMPHKKVKSRKNEDSDESCEGNSCSAKGSRHRDSSSKNKQATTKKPSTEAGRTRRPSSIDTAPVKLQETDITSIKTSGLINQADPSTGAACTTCTGVNPVVDSEATVVGTTGTTIETGGALTDPTKTGAADMTVDPATGAATGTVSATGRVPIRKPGLGEVGRIRNPSSINQTDPSTGAACTNCTPTNSATGTAGTISATEPSSATGTSGTIPIRKPSLGVAGRIRNPGSANLADPSTGAACTTCTDVDKAVNPANGTADGTGGTTGKIPITKPSLGEAESIKNTESVTQVDPSTKAACTNCTAADPATGTPRIPVRESLGSAVTTPVRKPIVLIDPARIRRPGTLESQTGSSSKSGSADNTTCTTCTSTKTSSLDESSLIETPAISDLVKKEADPSSTGAVVEAVSEPTANDSEIDPSAEGKILSRFNTTVVKTVDHIHFNYDDPNRWKEHNSLCKGAHQSPINIETRKTIISTLPDISFFNYDKSYPENLENNGHTVQLSIDKLIRDLPFITGGGLDGIYQFAQLHFHWGEGLLGSEHTIDGKQYVAEAHIVHWDMKYGSFINATKHNDGLHVLGILIELQARDNIAFRHLEQFDKLTEAGCAKTDQLSYSVPLADLLPDSTSSFYRYAGSLTDARCNEDVIWTVFDTPIAISERQLAKFRLLTDEHGKLLTKNVRPTQLTHKRTVIYNPPSAP